jgi:voltage-gated potassium channel Kch
MFLRALFVGLPTLVLCVALQSLFVNLALRGYARVKGRLARQRRWRSLWVLTTVMLLMLVGSFLQMAVWALLFLSLGEFEDYATAAYHSAVNFTTLGYGDVVMSERWRLLGALEAASGILMFGVSTAMMTAAVIELLKLDANERSGTPK